MANNNIWIWVAVGAIALVMAGVLPNPLDGFSAGNENGVDELYPSDLKTSVTLNTGDALATTALGANVSYYVFTDSGKFLKEGTTVSGTASFTVPSGANYKVILYDDDATGVDYLPIEVAFSTNGDSPENRAVATINVDLFRESTLNINKVRDPVDLDTNVSQGAGQTVNFDVLISATTSNAVVNKPVLRIEAQSNCTEEVYMPSLTAVTCPDRIAADPILDEEWCFQYDKQIKASEGIVTIQGNFVVDASTACGTVSNDQNMTFSGLDSGLYKEAAYKTKGYSAFVWDVTENPIDNSDVGAADVTNTGYLTFN